MLASVGLMALTVATTKSIDVDLQILVLSIGGCLFLGILVALLLARKDTTITIFVTVVGAFFSGVVIATGIFLFATQRKTGNS